MKIAILGAAGQLGGVMLRTAERRHNAVGFGRADADVTDDAALTRVLTDARPDCIINCSAYSQVDQAEDEPVAAFAANAIALIPLTRIAAKLGAVLVHYSTDFVFDGKEAGPNTETRTPRPRGAYATSKLAGEWLAAQHAQHYILRVESLFGGVVPKSSIDAMLASILAGKPVKAFSDRTVTPSYVVDVAEATLAVIERRIPFGVYHCVNSGVTTWVDVARELARLAGRPDAQIEMTRMADLALRVRRPLNAALSNDKLVSAGVEMSAWQDALARHVRTRANQAGR